jgi:Zn-dependent M16 (insulinase) family peptidase
MIQQRKLWNITVSICTISFGLQGIKSDKVDSLEGVIKSVLEKTAEEGFSINRIENIIHQTELSLKHVLII